MVKTIVKIAGLPILGFAVAATGFVYDVLFAGIPYQDPTPELQSQWEFHKSVAGAFYKTGGILLLLGLFAMPVIWRMTKRKCQ